MNPEAASAALPVIDTDMATAIRPDEVTSVLRRELGGFDAETEVYEVGTVLQVGDGIVRIYGLRNVQARVDYLNGTLDIQSKPGEGTSVLVEIVL